MSRWESAVRSHLRGLVLSWQEIPSEYRRLFLFVAATGLAPWLTVTSFDIQGYVIGAEQVLSGQSVYGSRVESPYTGRVVPRYPYLPSFAMLIGVGVGPLFLLEAAGLVPRLVYEVLARQVANAPGYAALIGLPVLSYRLCSPSGAGEFRGDISNDWVFWGVLLVALTPVLWIQVLESGSDSFVALLALLSVYAVTREWWLIAGLLVGVSTFKFTALPMAAVLALYALERGREQFTMVTIGGLVSQLPNVLYFAFFTEDLLFVVQQRGGMSLISGETRSVATAPLRAAGLEQWYVETGFFIVFVGLVALGAGLAIRRKNLVLGFAVAYLSASYFAPVGEVNPSVLVVLLLFEAAVNFRRQPVRYLAAGLLAVQFYGFVLLFRTVSYVSTVPFTWWDTAVRTVEFGTILIAIVGLGYYSDHGSFSPLSGRKSRLRG